MGNSDRRPRSLLAVLGASLALMTVIAPVEAATPQEVHIVAHMSKQGFGTFEATGSAVESGLVCEGGSVLGIDGKLSGWQSGQKASSAAGSSSPARTAAARSSSSARSTSSSAVTNPSIGSS